MIKILVVEDDHALNTGITLALKGNTFQFYQAYDLRGAGTYFSQHTIDLIILDVNLPDGSGFDFLSHIRRSSNVPVIILTANDLETDIVTGLELGADDYITKPFSLMVLRARVNTQLRKKETLLQESVKIDLFTFDFQRMEYKKGEQVIELSKTEQKLLKLLVENRNRTLTRAELVDRIWTDGAEYVDENALSVTMKRLRDKLEDNSSKPTYIKTVYGLGYTWAVK